MAYFPPYNAIPMLRGDVLEEYPELADPINELSAALTDEEMQNMNYLVDEEGQEPAPGGRGLPLQPWVALTHFDTQNTEQIPRNHHRGICFLCFWGMGHRLRHPETIYRCRDDAPGIARPFPTGIESPQV